MNMYLTRRRCHAVAHSYSFELYDYTVITGKVRISESCTLYVLYVIHNVLLKTERRVRFVLILLIPLTGIP